MLPPQHQAQSLAYSKCPINFCVSEQYRDHLLSTYVLHLGLSFAPLFSPLERGGKWFLGTIPGSQGERGKKGYKWWCFRQYPHAMDLLCEEIAFTINELESFCQCQLQEKTISKGHIDP